jgi:hypothetical protein
MFIHLYCLVASCSLTHWYSSQCLLYFEFLNILSVLHVCLVYLNEFFFKLKSTWQQTGKGRQYGDQCSLTSWHTDCNIWHSILLGASLYRPVTVGLTQPPIQRVSGALSLRIKRPGREADLHLVPRSRMRPAIPPLPQYAFMAWCSVKAQGQLHFTSLYDYIWLEFYTSGLVIVV